MGDQEHGQEGEGIKPSPGSPIENKLERLKQLFPQDLVYVGLFVFAITAVAMILFIVVFNFFPSEEGPGSYRHLKSTELLLTLAATGLVVAIIGRAQNPFVLAIGIFLIGALIVPSKDIVRFALIASGSDRSYESFFQSATSGTESAGRSTDVANKILTELIQAELMETLKPGQRKQAIRIVEGEVRKEREITLLEQVGSRGALGTLKATATDIEGWVYKYGKREKFIEDLRYLRSEGLISFAYDDLDTIIITSLGRDVLRRSTFRPLTAVPLAPQVVEPFTFDYGRTLQEFQELTVACPPDITPTSAPDVTDDLFSQNGRRMTIDFDLKYMRFVVSEETDYIIDIKVENQDPSAPTDPLLALSYLPKENGCSLLGTNDDYDGETLNSQLSLRLGLGTYLIGAMSIQNEGNVRVSVRKSD